MEKLNYGVFKNWIQFMAYNLLNLIGKHIKNSILIFYINIRDSECLFDNINCKCLYRGLINKQIM